MISVAMLMERVLNESLETNCRDLHPLAAWQGIGYSYHALSPGSAAVAQVKRYAPSAARLCVTRLFVGCLMGL